MTDSAKKITDLKIITPRSELLVQMTSEDVRSQLDLLLADSDLNAMALLTDLAAYLTANQKIAAEATPESLFVVLHAAARRQCTFGDGGLWILPDGGKVRAQESEKYITNTAKLEGWTITATLVWSDQEPIEVETDDSSQIVSVKVGQGNPFAAQMWGAPKKDEPKNPYLIGAIGLAEHIGGRRIIELLSKQDIERKRDHSAAFKAGKSPGWRDDAFEMVKRSVRAHMGRIVVPIRTKAPGGVSDIAAPPEPESIEVVGESTTTLHDDLEKRAADTEDKSKATDAADIPKEGMITTIQYTRIAELIKEKKMGPKVKELLENHYKVQTRKELTEQWAADLITWMLAQPENSGESEPPAQGELT